MSHPAKSDTEECSLPPSSRLRLSGIPLGSGEEQKGPPPQVWFNLKINNRLLQGRQARTSPPSEMSGPDCSAPADRRPQPLREAPSRESALWSLLRERRRPAGLRAAESSAP